MHTHVALLRGINVGGRNRVAMADLRDLVQELGHTDVDTYVQSGNVLLCTEQRDTTAMAAAMERALVDRLGVQAVVLVLARDELAGVIARNPYPEETNPKALHAVLLTQQPAPDLTDRVAAAQRAAMAKGSPDTAVVDGRVIYLRTPDGIGRSELAARLTRGGSKQVAATGTARNWATMTALLARCGG
ncbi:MAG TPA: DUF1697 domain-containing protein [Mycobacteriales bacterium]|nr:DUF1697 domain-containing protein [Mycobacteriales bacterium]